MAVVARLGARRAVWRSLPLEAPPNPLQRGSRSMAIASWACGYGSDGASDGDGRTWEAVCAVDPATHPNEQGGGIFKRLTASLLKVLCDEGVAHVFNTPHERSVRVT